MKKQAFNPYLPSYEYIPDGEPHVFGDRVYLYGSHDRFRGAAFCLNDYVCYSAPVTDLSDWRYEGVIYKKEQDPRNQNIPADAPPHRHVFGIVPERPEDINPNGVHAMWAPDVVKGPDGRYYLYYCLDYLPEVAVAVCDTPAGKYEFLGFVKHPDGTLLGKREGDLSQFDPGIFIDDNGTVYLYSGNAPMYLKNANNHQGSQVMTLCEDMVTLKSEPRRLIPEVTNSAGTGFEGHEFFEASSIRKIGDLYYFVYSSVNSHELCYAVSSRPDGDYRYGGTIVDIGDIYLNGRTRAETLNCLGNTHGGMEYIDGKWYIFYHRQTNRTNFSRQACAERIYFDENGHIPQVEITSCGLNDGPLSGFGIYPARICCQLTAANGNVESHPNEMKMDYPFVTQVGDDIEPSPENDALDADIPFQYICNMQDGSVAGYKYFDFNGADCIKAEYRGDAEGFIDVCLTADGEAIGQIPVKPSADWKWKACISEVPDGIHALYFVFMGTGRLDFRRFELSKSTRRDIKRIDPFLRDLGSLWKKTPDTRFGQLMVGFKYWLEANGHGDGFYLEDEKYIELLKEFMEG